MTKLTKIVVLYILCHFYDIIAKISINWKKLCSLDEAKKIIAQSGYYFIKESDVLPPLVKMDSCDFSIIVPVYNGEKYLIKCLDSLVNQKTSFRYEIVCVNDGSKDSSLTILNNYIGKYPHLFVVVSQENLGIAAARNKGLELAKGEYVGFVDNDDTVSDNYVELIVNAAKKNNADMVQCGSQYVNVEGKPLFTQRKKESVVLENNHTIEYLDNLSGFVWAGAYRRTLFEKFRFIPNAWYEDMVTLLILARLSNITVVLSECLYNYVMHGGNASSTLWKATSVKSLDSIYLPMLLFEISQSKLHLQSDEPLVCMIIHEMCWQFPNRAKGLSEKYICAAFVIISGFIRNNNIRSNVTRNRWNELCDAVYSGDYWRWKYIARSEMYRSKIAF